MAREATRISVVPDGSTAFFRGEAFQFDSDGKITTVGGEGQAIDGVVIEGCAATATYAIGADVAGITIGQAGAELTAGDHRALQVAADGQFIPYAADAADFHVANWIPNTGQAVAAEGSEITIVLIGSPGKVA